MRGKIAAMIATITAATVSGSACAMNSQTSGRNCQVVGGEKLPVETGGTSALCAAIERAAAARAPGVGYSITVHVLSPSRLAATITTTGGSTLPTVNHAISDRSLSKASVERFAAAIAAQLGNIAQR